MAKLDFITDEISERKTVNVQMNVQNDFLTITRVLT